jgi:16S rRNA C967 or C1407 C5-methylase (RsmB/RsmF family)
VPAEAVWSAATTAPLPATVAEAGRGLTLSPATTGTDGFFIAVLLHPGVGQRAGR